uniref:F-box domain-containing protein n=1 Tax=Quercus lobata TaxID=97700 RepID=A0A7N2M2L2_QUELO
MSDSNKSIRWGCLPDEIISHIFVFLPIKSIIICTSVSKTWKSLIKNPAFISTHLYHSHNNNKNILLLLWLSRNDKQVYALHNDDDDPDFTEYTSFDSPFTAPHLQPHHIACNVVGTCNGLLCLSDANEVFLWNPCVRKFLQLPSIHASRLEVDVYSLSTGEWRMHSASASLPPIWGTLRRERPAFANGALHWIGLRNDNEQFVLVFDLGDEVFRQILLPELPSYTGRMLALGKMVRLYWKMTEIKVVLEDNGIGEVVLLNDRRGLISWNPDSQNVKNLNGSHKTFLGSYVESLVLLDKATKGVVTY